MSEMATMILHCRHYLWTIYSYDLSDLHARVYNTVTSLFTIDFQCIDMQFITFHLHINSVEGPGVCGECITSSRGPVIINTY